MDRDLREKYAHLLNYLRKFDKVGVACSGGVDSTLLAYACCEALGADRVVILFADSCLLTSDVRVGIDSLIRRELPASVPFVKVDIDGLADEDFIRNDSRRCYICKKRIYTALFSHLKDLGIVHLCDGTNCDDLGQDRPGLKVIEELNVLTPLVEAGYRKTDVRTTAAAFGLTNALLASNSCLATRIETHASITNALLREVEILERFMIQRGYDGCRVRPRSNMVIIEVQSKDLPRITRANERQKIVSYFQQNGYTSALIDLSGRSD